MQGGVLIIMQHTQDFHSSKEEFIVMKLNLVLKNCLAAALMPFALSAFAMNSNHDNKINFKQMDSRSAKAVEAWEFSPPYTGYGFGQYQDDHRIQKIIVHVDNTLPNSNERSGTVKLICNGTEFMINANETVVCERSLDNLAMLQIVLDEQHQNPSSAGTVKFIMEDIK